MFQIKKLRKIDFTFAVELANTMDWNMAPEDFEFMNMLEPEGSFLLYNGSEKIGIATAISYDKLGWFGNLIVKKEYRGGGGGSALVDHAVNFLCGRGVKTIGLYAYPHLVDFYTGLGFKQDEDFSVLQSTIVRTVAAEKLPEIEKSQLSKIIKFDKDCFGGDRTRLLKAILPEEDNLSFQVTEDDQIVGYVAVTVYPTLAWVGPLICQSHRSDVARSLVMAALSRLTGKNVYSVIPKNNSVLFDTFVNAGFRENFFVKRMFWGQPTGQNCIYMAESLERG